MTSTEPVAIFGGTFDPVHRGHINPLLELADRFAWQAIHLQPTFAPPHRPQPVASDQHRLAMLQLAAREDERLVVDDFELRRGQPTRTVHTLNHLRSVHPQSAICFILGMDSFIQFCSWLNWTEILTLCHLIVLPRPGYQIDQAPAKLQHQLARRQSTEPADFAHGSGLIYLAGTAAVDISATELRHALGQHSQCPDLIDPAVYQYIEQNHLYR